jgi:hypothetical protein
VTQDHRPDTAAACPCQGYECRHIPIPSRWQRFDGATVDIYRDPEGALHIDTTEAESA